MHLPLNVNTEPNRRRLPCICSRKGHYYGHQEEDRFSPCLATAQPMRDYHYSANEKPLYLELPVSSSRLFVYNSPFQLSLLLYKRVSSPLLYQACMWFTIVSCLRLRFLQLQNKLVLLIKITDCLIVLG